MNYKWFTKYNYSWQLSRSKQGNWTEHILTQARADRTNEILKSICIYKLVCLQGLKHYSTCCIHRYSVFKTIEKVDNIVFCKVRYIYEFVTNN